MTRASLLQAAGEAGSRLISWLWGCGQRRWEEGDGGSGEQKGLCLLIWTQKGIQPPVPGVLWKAGVQQEQQQRPCRPQNPEDLLLQVGTGLTWGAKGERSPWGAPAGQPSAAGALFLMSAGCQAQ